MDEDDEILYCEECGSTEIYYESSGATTTVYKCRKCGHKHFKSNTPNND